MALLGGRPRLEDLHKLGVRGSYGSKPADSHAGTAGVSQVYMQWPE